MFVKMCQKVKKLEAFRLDEVFFKHLLLVFSICLHPGFIVGLLLQGCEM